VFRREGEFWTIVYERQLVRLKDTKGLRYLSRLLCEAGHGVPVSELLEREPPRDVRAAERARISVTRAIKNAEAKISERHPSLANHLRGTVRTGALCSYRPDPRLGVHWSL
jgi:hypothetical protein